MSRTKNPKPMGVFEDTISDAYALLDVAEMLKNQRQRRMRAELRNNVGQALRIPQRTRDELDGIESSHAFIVLLPDGELTRTKIREARKPILRQAVVAASAAVEAYVVARAVSFVSEAMKQPEWPQRMAAIQVTLGDIQRIRNTYTRHGWGYREIIENFIEEEASPSPNKIGQIFSAVGQKLNWNELDQVRGVPRRQSECDLATLYERRNQIAHRGDRKGGGRAKIEYVEVRKYVDNASSVVQ